MLPPITRGRTVPEFEQAAFNTPVGQTTGVIRTSYGFHIIHVEGKQSPAEAAGRSEGADRADAEAAEGCREAQNMANTVQTLARTDGLDKAAATRG